LRSLRCRAIDFVVENASKEGDMTLNYRPHRQRGPVQALQLSLQG